MDVLTLAHSAGLRCGRRLALAFGLLAGLMAGPVLAQAPAQKPLLSRDGGSVKANIVLNLDESGSMAYQYMPEKNFKVDSFTVAFPDDDGLIMHPSDPKRYAGTFVGTVLGDPLNTTSVFQRQMRSPDVNSIYYNPDTLYLPWVNADGTRMPAASPTAAKFDPIYTLTPATTSLIITSATSTFNGTNYCSAINTSNFSLTCSNNNGQRYAPGLYYRLQKNGDGTFKNPYTASNYDAYDINKPPGAGFPKHANRTDCSGATCTQAQERQNFANWFVYYRSRMLLAQGAIPEAFVGIQDKFRLGWARIHKGSTTVDGQSTAVVEQGVRDYTAAHKADFFNWMRDQDLVGGTPLRQAMYGVGQYFSRTDNRSPWMDNPASAGTSGTEKTCRRSFHVLVTDGYWNDNGAPLTLPNLGNVDNTDGGNITGPGGRQFQYDNVRPYADSSSNTLADVSSWFWKQDLRTNIDNKVQPTADNPAFWQNMVNFTVGLGVKGLLDPATDLPDLTSGAKSWGSDKIDDLWHAAVNSRGEYFSAKDPGELTVAIRSALNKASERDLLEAGVATASTVLEANNRKYIPRYKTAVWSGDVEAFNLDGNGQAGTRAWSAIQKLPTWSDRKIFTWREGTSTMAVPFTWTSLTPAAQSLLWTSTIVDFIRGDRSMEGSGPTDYRVRENAFGDFINSNPVFARDGFQAPYLSLPASLASNSYATYVNNVKRTRSGALYVGGNGGMLHGFKETRGAAPAEDGKEIFAFVPRAVYPSLTNLASRTYGTTDNYHSFFVDGPLAEGDVHVPPPAGGPAEWRNYLFGATGNGGRAVFAIDITNPDALNASSIRWEINSSTQSDLGYVLFPIQSGVLPNGKWVALFGNGYGSTSGGAYLFVVDVATGAVQKLGVDTASTDNGLGGVAIVRNAEGAITTIYAGDMKGKLWKMDYLSTAPSNFTVANAGTAFFNAGTSRPIIQPPAIFDHSQGGKIVVFGTGRLITETDADTTNMQTMYGVRDNPPESYALPLTISSLATRTIAVTAGTGTATGSIFFGINGEAVNWTTKRGWAIDLSISGYTGLRVIYPPQPADARFVLISAVSPAQNLAVCEQSTGKGANFLFPVETGLPPTQNTFDTNGDGVINDSDQAVVGYASNADGVDAVLRGDIQSYGSGGECLKLSIQNTTGQVLACIEQPPHPPGGTPAPKDRVWRRLLNPPIR